MKRNQRRPAREDPEPLGIPFGAMAFHRFYAGEVAHLHREVSSGEKPDLEQGPIPRELESIPHLDLQIRMSLR